ncbi:GDSL esterase/lipase At3g27950 [Apium graveolens]|uniref:GDSL esterase/lipase At3g27950 n=1 Tax=Apium graveolens TaxID=4045 RepID=UPI003D797EE1
MGHKNAIWVLWILLSTWICAGKLSGHGRSCHFPAIYNFGDSNSDTGGKSAAMWEINPPNGETFFKKPSGRYCNGRIVVDFIAERLGLPYLSPYLDSIGTNFRHGANFATGGSSILPGGYSPFDLDIQIAQFMQFKSRTTALYKQLSRNSTLLPLQNILPRPRDFSKALYTFDIGQNDLNYGFQYTNETQVLASIPGLIAKFSQAVYQLYKEGARYFWIHNTGPLGCLPYSVIYDQSKLNDLDRYGCVVNQNNAAQEFNRQLKDKVSQLMAQLPNSAFTYVDIYNAKYKLISAASNYGFEDPHKFCCGGYYGFRVECGGKAVVNGTVYENLCTDPSRHISWDGIHYSQAANLFISKLIMNGSLSTPPNTLPQACRNPQSL